MAPDGDTYYRYDDLTRLLHAYADEFPLAEGWQERVPLHQLAQDPASMLDPNGRDRIWRGYLDEFLASPLFGSSPSRTRLRSVSGDTAIFSMSIGSA